MCKHTVRNIPYLLRYFLDQCKTEQNDEAVLENIGTLKSFPDCYKNQNYVIKQLIITLMR